MVTRTSMTMELAGELETIAEHTIAARRLRTPCVALLMLLTSSCLRYVPSQHEMAGGRKADSIETADPELFRSFEHLQHTRLDDLIKQRSSLIRRGAADAYNVGAGDIVDISVFDIPELNVSERVAVDGSISLPLVGTFYVGGLTEDQIREALKPKLKPFVVDPQIRVFIKEYNARKISVVGEVAKPGVYPLKGTRYTVLDLISEAGGRTGKAGYTVVLIPALETVAVENTTSPSTPSATLPDEGKRHGIEIQFDDLVGSVEKLPLTIPLVEGDTIVLPETGSVQVDGEVKRPGSVPLTPRMTLMGLIASAGGLTYSADVGSVEVIRELGEGKKVMLSVNLDNLALKNRQDVALRSGDVVRVPSAMGRFITRQIVDAINTLFRFGVNEST